MGGGASPQQNQILGGGNGRKHENRGVLVRVMAGCRQVREAVQDHPATSLQMDRSVRLAEIRKLATGS